MKNLIIGKDKFETYEHHGMMMVVRSDLKGKHRDYCLCHQCANFKPGKPENCEIAQALYEFDLKHVLVTPVWECKAFIDLLTVSNFPPYYHD